MPDSSVVVHDSKSDLIAAVARRFLLVVADLAAVREIHVCFTGGSVGIAILDAVGRSEEAAAIDWHGVHFWWGDERWLPAGDAERNDKQATDALLGLLDVPAGNIHRFPASDEGIELEVAVGRYTAELRRHASGDAGAPAFDITFLGVGPDGHVASLFPHHDQVSATGPVVAERNSPKPPPERLSLTLPVLNASERIWLVVSGADKASAIGLALAGASRHLVPVAGVRARGETIFFVDRDAAADVPRELITDSGDY